MSKRVLVVSSANMDMKMPLVRIPEEGETLVQAGNVTYSPGGKGANSAVAFAKLGAECVFCTRVGHDAHGETLYDYYRECGIDISCMPIDKEAATGFAAILVEEKTGKNRIVCYPGANRALREEDVDRAILRCPDALYMQLEMEPHIILYAANQAHRQEIPVFIDAGPADKSFPLEQLPPLTVFSPNESETEIYTGIRPANTDACLAACFELSKKIRAKYIVLKLGERGAFIYDGRRFSLVPAFQVKAVDTTAAGDAFTAALTLQYLQTGDIHAAARYASAVAALTVCREGASFSIPTRGETESFLQKNKAL